MTGRTIIRFTRFSTFAWAPQCPQAVLGSETQIFGNSSSSSTRCIIHFFFGKKSNLPKLFRSPKYKFCFCGLSMQLAHIDKTRLLLNLTFYNEIYALSFNRESQSFILPAPVINAHKSDFVSSSHDNQITCRMCNKSLKG